MSPKLSTAPNVEKAQAAHQQREHHHEAHTDAQQERQDSGDHRSTTFHGLRIRGAGVTLISFVSAAHPASVCDLKYSPL